MQEPPVNLPTLTHQNSLCNGCQPGIAPALGQSDMHAVLQSSVHACVHAACPTDNLRKLQTVHGPKG